jgi:DNA-directed RNA polymerase specialized sigma24 family protein
VTSDDVDFGREDAVLLYGNSVSIAASARSPLAAVHVPRLTDGIDRVRWSNMGSTPHPSQDRCEGVPSTLGAVPYGDRAKVRMSEQQWVALLEAIARGDQRALHALYTQTQGVVFTLIVRIGRNRETAESLTLEIFYEVWQKASTYVPSGGSVVGWIMNLAQYRAIGRLRFRELMERVKHLLSINDASPPNVLYPSASLWERLARRIATATGQEPLVPAPEPSAEPEWEDVAPGIACKLLATDTENDRVSMLVRLAPGAAYPPHTHAGIEEPYLLHGELVIDDKKLYPGDYNRGEPGAGDQLVWSETGCTCVLLTSTRDILRGL